MPAQILTPGAVPGLVQELDAGDVLECYLLHRPTGLLTVFSPLPLQKAVVAIRHRTSRREWTLEFGPLRGMGDNETVPVLFGEDGVTWDNQGKVYYSQKIEPEAYRSASYMASMSGAVLGELLLAACEYPTRRRYQPFAVYNSNNQLLLKSSNDVDFVQALWEHLASVGVELRPLLQPKYWRLQLQATAVEKVQVGVHVSRAAVAQFYTDLYHCLGTIAAGPVVPMDESPTASSSGEGSAASNEPTTDTISPGEPPQRQRRQRKRRIQSTTPFDPTGPPRTDVPIQASHGFDGTLHRPNTTLSGQSNVSLASQIAAGNASLSNPILGLLSAYPSQAPTTTTSMPPSFAPSFSPAPTSQTASPVSHSEQAAAAAAAAQEAAAAANKSGNAQAAEAAQNAAAAAHQAATATASQEATYQRDALLSGDGSEMAQAASACFKEPWTTSNNVVAYLYVDGSFYYRVNLTTPFVRVVPRPMDLPQPPQLTTQGGDWVDWSIFLVLVGVVAIGSLLLVQQVFGRNLGLIRPLYRCQRWFFDPLQHDDQDWEENGLNGEGHVHGFGEDVIPLSMGGRRPDMSLTGNGALSFGGDDGGGDSNGQHSYKDVAPSDHPVEVELTTVHRSPYNHSATRNRRSSSRSSWSDDEFLSDGEGTESRLFRNPDLVELPDLSSSSRVAMPVGHTSNSDERSFE